MTTDTNGIIPIEYASAIVAIDVGTVVIGLFDGDPRACVAILKSEPEAARALAEKIGSALNLIE